MDKINKIQEITLKVLVIASAIICFPVLLKVPEAWWLPVLSVYLFSVVAGRVLLGRGVAAVILGAAILACIMVIFKALVQKMDITPFALEIALFVFAYLLMSKADDTNNYAIYSMKDQLKSLEAEYETLIKEEILLKAGVEANRQKLEKYMILKEIKDGLANHNMFSSRMRHILRNVISIFHQEKSISLFLIKDGKFLKAEATKHDDMLVGEPDQESLYLKSFDEWIINNKKGIIVSDMHKEVRFRAEAGDTIRSLIAVPVFAGTEVAGVLRIYSPKENCFNHEDLRFLDLIAEMISSVFKEEAANAK